LCAAHPTIFYIFYAESASTPWFAVIVVALLKQREIVLDICLVKQNLMEKRALDDTYDISFFLLLLLLR
jgi:hypothetical protein